MRSGVLKLIVSRAAQGLVVLVVVSALTFALLAAAGGDALDAMYNDPHVSLEVIESLRASYGLDRPLPVRYARWLTGALRGDLGFSFYYRAPVGSLLLPRFLHTLVLGALALSIAWGLALALGALSARAPRGWADRSAGALILLASSTPRIVLALLALVVAARWALFSTGDGGGGGGKPMRALLAALVLSAPLVALFLAQTREGLREALGEEFVRVARAKGLSERRVVFAHAMRAALNPLVTVFGYSLGGVVSGSVIVETILGWPGLGQLSVTAVRSRDVPLLMAVVVVTSTAVLVGNLIADILLRLNDPRIGWDESGKAAGA
ncbi:MAG TPA: ABC transporter permease [Pyrinomonadaceae bacterium]